MTDIILRSLSQTHADNCHQKTTAMVAMMQQLGEKESPPIRFSYGGDIADTLDSHRLLDWALETYGADVQARVVEALSTRYFERELSVGDHTVLVDAAREGGARPAALVLCHMCCETYVCVWSHVRVHSFFSQQYF